jgi:glycosidase
VYPRAHSPAGTLEAVAADLDRIAALGACAIWLLPIHPPGRERRKGARGSPYAVRDYRAVDPGLGTLEDLRRLVAAAHSRGLRVIIDFVANHAAPDHVLAGEHPEWFAADGRGRPVCRVPDWTDVADWRFEVPGPIEYLAGSAEHWVREAGIDGYRCDVAGMVARPLWREVNRRLTALEPDHFLLAEWQDPELHEIAFHASYDWALYRALRDAALGRWSASAVGQALRDWSANFPANALPLRFVENHDEPRALAVFGRERLAAAAAVAFLSGGLPLVYAGQEIGAVHRPSLFEAEPIDWSRRAGEIETLYRDLIALQRRGDPWGIGRAEPVATDRPETVVAFLRRGARREGLVVVNLGRGDATVRLEAGDAAHEFQGVLGRHRGITLSRRASLAPGEVFVGEAPGGTGR